MKKPGRKPCPRILPERQDFLKAKREEKGYTLENLSTYIRYSLTHINKVFKGERGGSLEFWEKLTDVLDIEEGPAILIGEKALLELNQRSTTIKPEKAKSNIHYNSKISLEELENFYGREFVFNKIEQFLSQNSKGYYTIKGQPGIGKSAIIGQYYHTHKENCIAYTFVSDPQLFHFIEDVCEELHQRFMSPEQITETKRYDKKFLEHCLQQASNWLVEKGQKLVIAVDAVEDAHMPPEWDKRSILCLPEQLPENIYFLLARRPFAEERLCVDPGIFTDSLDLNNPIYDENNQADIIECLEGYLDNSKLSASLNQWLDNNSLTRESFIKIAAEKSESNFMYVKYLVEAIAGGLYTEADFNQLPKGLDEYYHTHWRLMKMGDADQQHKARILYTLLELETPATSIILAAITGQQTHSVFNFLKQWKPFLKEEDQVDDKTFFSIYHASFADFLRDEKLREEKTGLTRQEINASIDDYCSEEQSQKEKPPEIYLRKPTYQIKAERSENLYQTLTDYKFIADKIINKQFGVYSLISDYEKALNHHGLLSEDQEKILSLIRDNFRLSSHILAEHSDQLASRLWGHLQDQDRPKIQELLKQAKNQQSKPWLRPLTRCFSSPGSALLQTLVVGDWVTSVAITSDGKRMVSGSRHGAIKVWDVEGGEKKADLLGYSGGVTSVGITPDGKRVVSGSSDRTIKVWDVKQGVIIANLTGHGDRVTSVGITSDGKRVVSGLSDRTIKVWDVEQEAIIANLTGHNFWVNSVAITPDGKRVVSSSSWDATIKVWDVKREKVIADLLGHNFWVTSVGITPGGKRVVSGSSWDATIKVWDVKQGVIIANLTGHDEGVISLAITSDGKRVVSGSSDNTVKIWDVCCGGSKVICSLNCDSKIKCFAIAPDNTTIVAGDEFGRLYFLKLEEGMF